MNRLISLFLIISLLFPSLAYSQEVRRDEAGNYILTEQAFTDLWAQYNFYKRELEAEKTLSLKLKEELKKDGASTKRLMEQNQRLTEINKELVTINNKSFTSGELILISVMSSATVGMFVYVLMRK